MKNHLKPIRKERIIQFGEGNFLRAFVDWMVQILNDKTDFEGSVVVVQPIKEGMCDKLDEQNCVYTHVMRGLENGEPKVYNNIIDVISRTVKPYDDWASFLELAHNPDFRFVVSNTTESGIAYDESDEMTTIPPKTFPAKVTALLYERFKSGLDGFIFLPCELIEKNGSTLKNIILKYADKWRLGEDFKDWVRLNNSFYNTLVDRIVTGYPREEKIELGYEDNLIDTSELFHLWVIEGSKSILHELPFDKTDLNVIVTDNLDDYRTRKVRILNGAHTAMVPYALLEGVKTVGECMKNEKIYGFIKKCIFEEIIPTLTLPEDELVAYAKDVLERFNNPYIKHQCASISLNSISKFKVRVLPSILGYVEKFGKLPENLVFSFYKLIEFYKVGTPNDAPEIVKFIQENTLDDILKNQEFWGISLYPLLAR